MSNRVTQIPLPDDSFDIRSRAVRPAMSDRTGHTLTESAHADCADCDKLVDLAFTVADRNGFAVLDKTNGEHIGRVWAYDPD